MELRPLISDNATSNNPFQQHRDAERQLILFNICWAIATLFHLANHQVFANSFWHVLLTLSAIFLLAKPSSVERLMLLILMQLFQFTVAMPNVVNHWIFTAFVNLTILQAALYLCVKQKTFVISKELLLKHFAPVVRVELMIFYFYVVFHKLNSGFFAPAVSCATDFLLAQDSTGLFRFSDQFIALNAFITIGVELIIPILLFFRRTRYLGVVIGVVFHSILAFNPIEGFYDFSSMIFATYILFTTERFIDQVYSLFNKIQNWKNNIKRSFGTYSTQKFFLFFVMVFIVFGTLMALIRYLNTIDFFREFFWTVFNLAFLIPLLLTIRKAEKGSFNSSKNFFKLPSWSFLLIPLIVFLNGLSPYLGLKTENSFAMFSNLRTEGSQTNHYLVPASSQIFDFQKDLIEIVTSTDSLLAESVAKKELIVYFAFKKYVQYKKPTRIVYIRSGQRKMFEYHNPATHGDLMTSDPKMLQKLLNFRNISKHAPEPCNH